MKHFYQTFLILIVSLFVSFPILAGDGYIPSGKYDFKKDGLYFNIISTKEKTCEVTRGDQGEKTKYIGDIEIPEFVEYSSVTYKVIRIKNEAFYESPKLISLTIPNSVTMIGAKAFSGCDMLTNISIPNSVTEIGEKAFTACPITSLVLPSSLKKICKKLCYASRLESVTIPNSVTEIGDEAFLHCRNLQSVTIPSSVTVMGEGVFVECMSLKSAILPDSLTEMGHSVFMDCKVLASVNIPKSLKIIDDHTFYGCSLKELVIPASVLSIGEEAFTGSGIKSITFEASDKPLRFDDDHTILRGVKSMTIGRKLSSWNPNRNINLKAFGDSIENLRILNDVESISYLFDGLNDDYPSLTTLTIGKDVIDYPESMINCNQLKTLTLQDPTPRDCPKFTESQYTNINVYVPKGSLSAYQKADGWKNFWNISESGEAGINEITSDLNKTEVGRYDLYGRRVSSDYRGITIVRYSDGTVEKIINK